MGYYELSNRILIVKMNANPFNIAIIVVYAPTATKYKRNWNVLLDARKQQVSMQITRKYNCCVSQEWQISREIVYKSGLGTRNEHRENGSIVRVERSGSRQKPGFKIIQDVYEHGEAQTEIRKTKPTI